MTQPSFLEKLSTHSFVQASWENYIHTVQASIHRFSTPHPMMKSTGRCFCDNTSWGLLTIDNAHRLSSSVAAPLHLHNSQLELFPTHRPLPPFTQLLSLFLSPDPCPLCLPWNGVFCPTASPPPILFPLLGNAPLPLL